MPVYIAIVSRVNRLANAYLMLNLIIPGIIIIAAAASVRQKKLTVPAAVTGTLIACLMYIGAGYQSLLLLCAFFVLGVGATAWKKENKAIPGSKPHQQQRTTGQVLANGGMAGLLAAVALFMPEWRNEIVFLIAASLASATADTVSSELGIVYGRNHYNIITWQKDRKGLDGVVSLEGTLLGIAGAALIALLYGMTNEPDTKQVCVIIIAGTFGNLTDSLLGASLERKEIINNNIVNFLNTAVAVICALLL